MISRSRTARGTVKRFSVQVTFDQQRGYIASQRLERLTN
jgi:hypothetical protein